MEEEILKKSTEVYLKYGIRSVTMDDISRELGISKKTVYQYFKDKDDLVEKVVSRYITAQECEFTTCCTPEMNAIDTLLEISKWLIGNHNKINPAVLYDLQKYHAKAWNLIEKFRRSHTYDHIYLNMEQGVNEGLYRNDFKIDIIASLYVFRMDQTWEFLTTGGVNYSFEDIFNTQFIYHIRGIANEKGLEYLNKKIKNEKLN